MSILAALLVLILALLALAWYDGGMEEQRSIIQSVDLPSGLVGHVQ